MTSLTEFLFPEPARRTPGAIVGWWERRRLVYNLIVGASGLVSVASVSIVGSFLEGDLFIIPWQPIVAFGVLANLCYLLGPAAEILIDKLWGRTLLPTGPALYRMGLTFSVGLALFPTLIVSLFTVIRVFVDSNFP